MAIVKVTKGGKTLSQAINYASKEDKTFGKDVADTKEKALEEMKLTKETYNKTDGRQYKHYIHSFAHGEVDIETAQKISLELAQKNFKGFEVFIGTHTDKEHIHNHLVVNSVNFETGKKFNVPKSFLQDLRNSNDEIAKEYGLEIVESKQINGEVRASDQKKYQVLKKAFKGEKESFILQTAKDVKKTCRSAKDKTDFLKNMAELGYRVNWSDTRKHVTFTDKDGNKVRLSNLEKTFSDNTFSKRGLENEFKRNLERGCSAELGEQQPKEQRRAEPNGTNRNIERNEQTERIDEVLYIRSHGQTSNNETDNRQRVNEDTRGTPKRIGEDDKHKRISAGKDDFNFEEAKRSIAQEQRRTSNAFREFRERNQDKQSSDNQQSIGNRKEVRHSVERHTEKDRGTFKQNEERDQEHDFER